MKSRDQKIGSKLICIVGDRSSYRLQIMWFLKIWNSENIFSSENVCLGIESIMIMQNLILASLIE